MAYLNVVKIENVCSKISSEDDLERINHAPLLNGSVSIMEGIKYLFDYGVDIIGVEDDDNKIIGKFSLKNLKHEITN